MKIIQFYIFSELIKKIFIMTAGFTLLVTFFNFINELDSISNNTFTLRNIFFIQALKLSTVIYEVLPIGTLIGGLWAFATIAATSEFIAMRVGGFTPYLIFKIICIAWIPLLVVSLFLSELLMPLSNKLLGKNQSLNQSSSSVSEFKSGYWLRDRVGESTAENKEFLPNTERIVNFSSIDIKKMIKFITIFEFNQNNILTRRISAESAGYFAANDNFFDAPDNFRGYWKLINPKVIILSKDGNVLVSEPAQITLHTKLSVETIDALTIHPEKMSLYNLKNFINYIKERYLHKFLLLIN